MKPLLDESTLSYAIKIGRILTRSAAATTDGTAACDGTRGCEIAPDAINLIFAGRGIDAIGRDMRLVRKTHARAGIGAIGAVTFEREISAAVGRLTDGVGAAADAQLRFGAAGNGDHAQIEIAGRAARQGWII